MVIWCQWVTGFWTETPHPAVAAQAFEAGWLVGTSAALLGRGVVLDAREGAGLAGPG
jgi:hypothetical protein